MGAKKIENSEDASSFLRGLLEQREILKIVISALTNTIEKYTQTPVTVGKPYLVVDAKKDEMAVAGLVKITGPKLSVELFLGFSKETFFALYNSMFQSDATEITTENHDLAGEILNIAFGEMDPEFKKGGFDLHCSFPQIYSGEELKSLLSRLQAIAIGVPYESNGKTFIVEIYATGALQVDWRF